MRRRASSRSFGWASSDFREIEEASEGLGPLFNGTGCASCHNVPAIGGGSPMTEMRAGARDADGNFRIVGGTTLYQLFSIPDHRCQSAVPAEATIVARRMSIPLFGAGLIEAIADETLLALEDPFDRDRDGISGRAAIVTDVATGSAASAVRLEGAGRDAADVFRRRLHQ